MGFCLSVPSSTTTNRTKKTVSTVQRRLRRTRQYRRKSAASSISTVSARASATERRRSRLRGAGSYNLMRFSSSTLPPEDDQAAGDGNGGFAAAVEPAPGGAVGYKNDVLGSQQWVRGLSGKDFSEIDCDFAALSGALGGADDSRLVFGGGARQAFGQGDGLQNGNVFVSFQQKPAGLFYLADDVHHARARHFDEIAGIHGHVRAGITGLEQSL